MTRVEIRAGSLFLSRGFQGVFSRHQAWQQAPLPTGLPLVKHFDSNCRNLSLEQIELVFPDVQCQTVGIHVQATDCVS